ncbi:MAG: hypothetical protein ACFFAO_06415 [Candidatus Hermodarchaeota archaeon]
MEKIKLLYANGLSIRTIESLTGVPRSTIGDHVRGIARLPKRLQQNPLELLNEVSEKQVEEILQKPLPNARNLYEAGVLKDIDYLLENYEKGTRFLPDLPRGERLRLLDQISLEDLQKLMDEPTDYHSPLPMKEWAVYYLSGKEGRFLLHSPHQWCNIQYEIFDLWEAHNLVMIETFRGVGKTMAADAILTHEICEHRDNNYFIMSETQLKAGFRVKHIGDTLLTNKLLIADYGFLPHVKTHEGVKQSWRWHRITVKRHFHQTDPTLIAFSSETAVATGMHFAGGVFDDVWSFKLEQNCQVNKEKWLGWRDGELEGCMEHAWELWLLTRKGPTDLYQDIEDRQMHAVYKRPAVIKFPSNYEIKYKTVKGKKIFDRVVVNSDDWEISDDGNNRFSIEYFIEKMTKMDSIKWESEYQLNPIAAKGRFWKENDLRYINGYTEFFNRLKNYGGNKSFNIVGFMDLGFGKTSRADFTALAIVAYWEQKYYFLELYLKRGATESDIVKMCAEACKTFPQIRTIYIEDDLQQTNKVERLKKKIPFVIIKGFSSRQEMKRLLREDSARRANLEGKPLRIWCQLEAIIEDNRFYVNKYMRNYKEFKDEYKTFPSCKHFDVLDAVGNAVGALNKKSAFLFVVSGR